MHVRVFPSFPSLIFLSKKKGIGAHFSHITQGFMTWCYPKPFFLFWCLRNAAGLWERGGPFCLQGEELCAVAPKSLQRRVPIAQSGKGDLPVNGDSHLHNERAYLCCSSSAPRWRPVPRAGLNWEVYGEKSDLPFWGQSLWTEADTSWALMACLPE